jgi:hypothetical protein
MRLLLLCAQEVDNLLACNFTEDELRAVFLVPEAGLVYQLRIPPVVSWLLLRIVML